jgi:hypothetical protein
MKKNFLPRHQEAMELVAMDMVKGDDIGQKVGGQPEGKEGNTSFGDDWYFMACVYQHYK